MLVIDRRAPRGRRRRVGARRITRVRGTGVSCPKRPPRLSQRSATGVASTSRHSAPAKSATGPTSSSRRAAHTRTRCRSNRLQSGRASRPTSPRSVAQSSGATRCSRVVSLSIGRTRNGSRPGCRRTTPTPSVAASSTYTSGAARRSPHIFAFDTGSHAFETATLDGNAAVLWYDPTGRDQGETMVSVFDEARGIEYITVSAHSSIDLATTVAIARNLYR